MNNNLKDQLSLNISFPLDLSTERITYRSCVKMIEDFENTCLDLIMEACKESGINNLVLLNKKAIVEAFKKQLPTEPMDKEIALGDRTLACPSCGKTIVNVWNKADYKPNYCHYCGQRFDWGKKESQI